MKISFRRDSIGVTARELLALEAQASQTKSAALELARKVAKTREQIAFTRKVLSELISDAQNLEPKLPLPGTFSINGIIIDISQGSDHPEVFEAPELGYLFEPDHAS